MPIIQEIDSGSYEVSLNGTSLGYAWFTLDSLNNRMAYFVTPAAASFPFNVPMDKTLSFHRIDTSFTTPDEFSKWSKAQFGGAPVGTHLMLESLLPWDGQ